jgi:aspartate/methionine/tyrosine aminotransferase
MQISHRAASFPESVIREMTRQHALYGGVNLAQGYPDFDPPPAIVEAAARALRDGYNQYAITWGAPQLREAIARTAATFNHIPTDPAANVTVTCGATEAMIATLMAVLNPGDEVIVLAPFYENYGPDAVLSSSVPRYVTLHEPDWRLDPDELAAAVTPRTRAIIVNTPHNPTGKVFTRSELELIADLCRRRDLLAVTDEIYEHILYDGREHISLASLPEMRERTVTISGLSKTFSVTGWRLGYAIAPAEISVGIRRVHDFLTVGAPHPLQMAAVAALELPSGYYQELVRAYSHRRRRMAEIVEAAGLPYFLPEGAYYMLADISEIGFPDDTACADWLVREVGVAVVPGSSFYPAGSAAGRQRIRFAFPKRDETLDEAARRLRGLADRARARDDL